MNEAETRAEYIDPNRNRGQLYFLKNLGENKKLINL